MTRPESRVTISESESKSNYKKKTGLESESSKNGLESGLESESLLESHSTAILCPKYESLNSLLFSSDLSVFSCSMPSVCPPCPQRYSKCIVSSKPMAQLTVSFCLILIFIISQISLQIIICLYSKKIHVCIYSLQVITVARTLRQTIIMIAVTNDTNKDVQYFIDIQTIFFLQNIFHMSFIAQNKVGGEFANKVQW